MKYDIHCHLTNKEYSNPNTIITECEKNNISIILNGLDYEDNEKVLEFSKTYSNVHASLGMHPTNIFDSKIINQIIKNKDKIISIGEVGIDYKEGVDETQLINFRKIIQLAEKLSKPLIIHSRNAEKEVINELISIQVPAILHCFTGKKKLLKEALNNPNIYFSIPANIKYSQQFQDLVKEIQIEKLLCETDSPYLWKECMNTPLNVIYSYEKISQLKGISIPECEDLIEKTVKTVFKLSNI
ncbi:MAG: TatD family hydrolase [Candidatus Nanoarchaeia archaeon]|nr:TatD family hydrolase [Candidatus Nanoarchaeia archaeon]